MSKDISIIIPSRNEEFLSRTIDDILSNIEADTEIIVGLDGQWADPRIKDDKRVVIVHYSESIGQRAITNQCVRLSTAKYIIKCDAHCAFDKGFDRKMLEAFKKTGDNVTMVPIMRNLHAFDWVCPKGHKRYQGPSGKCKECGEPTVKDIKWFAKPSPLSTSYRFDKGLHFQYFSEFKKRPEGKGELTETMSLQGSFFMLTREKYWELNICDEGHGSWGQQGTEVACKTWLSGGRCICNHNTWYAHMFRTQGGDFSFPYPISGSDQDKARQYSKDLFLNGKWDKAKHDVQWLVDKFAPVPDWNGGSKTAIYYTDNQLDEKIAEKCRQQLRECHIPIVSCSLKKLNFGQNIFFPSYKRSFLSMFKQIRGGLENTNAEIVYFCEHDVLYHPSHFEFTPPKKDRFYYNRNWWRLRWSDGHCLHFDADQLSGMCCYRDLALKEVNKVIDKIEKDGFSMKKISFEPGTRDGRSETFKSKIPIVDIRHNNNNTVNKWSKDNFRDKSTCTNWIESDEIPGWGKGKDIINGSTNLE